MPIALKCSGCEAKMNAPDAAAGKKVKCPKCGQVLSVPGAAASKIATAPAPKPIKKPPPPEDDEEEEQPKPKKKAVAQNDSVDADGEAGFGDLSDEEIEQVKGQMSGKERLLWAGKPSTKLMVVRALPFTIFGGLFVIVSIVTFFMMRGGTGAMELLLPLGFTLVGIGMCTAPFFAKAKAGRTFYALTNRRALVWKGGILWGASYEEFTAMQLGNYKRQNSWFVGGAGDLVFKEEVHITTQHHSGGYRGGRYRHGGTSQSVRIVQHGFLALPNVGEVEHLIKRKIIDKLNRALDEE